MIDWSPLRRELRHWQSAKMPLPIWWRDDDAVAETPRLELLRALAERLEMPVHIAVIPDLAEPSLPEAVAQTDLLVPVVHGWRHESHAPAGAKKAEFGHPRPQAAAEIAAGLRRLSALFSGRAAPMFVPPWNRISETFQPVLAETGYRVLSTFRPRAQVWAAPGLRQVNTHLDPIHWRGDRSLVAPETLIAGLVADLEARRGGRADAKEPYGLLTHHLVHDAAIWDFTHACLSELLSAGATPTDPMRGTSEG